MPLMSNQFHCINGHSFEANAKIRARCPECGASTKRSFAPTVPKPEPKPEPVAVKPKAKAEPPVDKPKPPILIRAGRPRVMATKPKASTPPKPAKRTIIGSKVSGGLVSRHKVTAAGTRPRVTGKPPKTAPARGTVAGREVTKPYWHSVADKYWR